jgi:hypothetical protein
LTQIPPVPGQGDAKNRAKLKVNSFHWLPEEKHQESRRVNGETRRAENLVFPKLPLPIAIRL